MSSLFESIADALRPDEDLLRLRSFFTHIEGKHPFYWPENLDAEGRHRQPTHGGHHDYDVCDTCRTFAPVRYWYGGYSINKQGEVVPNGQVPLCEECTREELR